MLDGAGIRTGIRGGMVIIHTGTAVTTRTVAEGVGVRQERLVRRGVAEVFAGRVANRLIMVEVDRQVEEVCRRDTVRRAVAAVHHLQ